MIPKLIKEAINTIFFHQLITTTRNIEEYPPIHRPINSRYYYMDPIRYQTSAIPLQTRSPTINSTSSLVQSKGSYSKPINAKGSTNISVANTPLFQFTEQFRKDLAHVVALAAYVSLQRDLDRTQNISLLAGAQRTSGALLTGANVVEAFQSPTSTLDQLGSLAEDYTLGTLQTSVLQEGAKRLGVDLSTVSAKELQQSALKWLIGDKASTTLIAAPSAPVAASSEVGTLASSVGKAGAGTSLVSSIGKVAGFAGAAYGAYELISNFGKSNPVSGAIHGAAMGAYIGSIFPGVGTLIGGALGAVAGGLLGCIKTGKHKDQIARDHMRSFLEEKGILNSDHQIQLADGSMYDIGKDGGSALTNIDGTMRHAYDVDFTNPLAGKVIGWIQPLTLLLTGGDKKLKDDFTGYFTNAALSNASSLEQAQANVMTLYQQAKATPEIMVKGLAALGQNGILPTNEYPAYMNGLQDLFSANGTKISNQT